MNRTSTRIVRDLAIALGVGIALLYGPPSVLANGSDRAATETAASEATRLLQALIRIPSVNPPGNEMPAARLLADFLRGEDIDALLVESSPGRGNVMARLEGDGSKRPILLLCHLDVVAVEDGWSIDPFAGEIRDGSVYGRGAIDDKGMCATNLIAFVELKRRNVSLARDVVFLATADEEGVGEGPRFMLEQFPQQLDVEFVLNEGGAGVIDAFTHNQVIFGVAAGDKGFARLHLSVHNRPGHGGIPTAEQAPHALIAALAHVRGRERALVFHEYMETMLRTLGEKEGGIRGLLMRHPRMFSSILLRGIATTPDMRAMVSNTLSIVELRATGTVATVPAVADAWLDARLLPGITPAEFRNQIEDEVHGFGVEVELEHGWVATTSRWDTELARALERHLPDGIETSVVAPIMGVAWTDSRFFRENGAIAYGIFPFALSRDELAGIHGHDEHLPIVELDAGIRRIYGVIFEVASTEGDSHDPRPNPRQQ